MEACYDGPQGPLELAPHIKAATLLHLNIVDMRRRAEDKVRDDEFDYEALLSSPLWGDIEVMRVAAAYADCVGRYWPRCSAPYFCRRQKASAGCGGRRAAINI